VHKKTVHKTWATLVLAALAGGGFSWQLGGSRTAAPERGPTSTTLPQLVLDGAAVDAITKIELTQPDWIDEDSHDHSVTIVRQGSGWEITSPIQTRASTSKVVALLGNLRDLSIREVIDRGFAVHDLYHLTEAQALHVVVWTGSARLRDLYFGRSDPRGQVMRIAGNDSVFVIAPRVPVPTRAISTRAGFEAGERRPSSNSKRAMRSRSK
jgi:Domain of unknown function (DUF4340)